jgi:hypothetical protein
MTALKLHVSRRKWKRKQLHVAQQMHGQILRELSVAHMVAVGTSLLEKQLRDGIGQRTAAFARDLQLVAPFAMHWLLKTRRHKLHRLQGCQLQEPLCHSVWRATSENQENLVASVNRASRSTWPITAMKPHAGHTEGQLGRKAIEHVLPVERDKASHLSARRQVLPRAAWARTVVAQNRMDCDMQARRPSFLD